MNVTDSRFDYNTGDGANILRVDDTFLSVDIAGSSFDDNYTSGIYIEGLHGATTELFNISNSTMNRNDLVGLEIRGEADTVFNVDITDSEINNTLFGGLLMTSFDRILCQVMWPSNECTDTGLLNSNSSTPD